MPIRDAARHGAPASAWSAYPVRTAAAAVCALTAVVGALLFLLVVFPSLRLMRGTPPARRARARRALSFAMRRLIGLSDTLRVLTYRFEGARRLGRPGQLIVANHPSPLDLPFLLAFARGSSCVADAALWRHPLTRGPMTAAGYICDDPADAMIEGAATALREGQSVIMFPEGECSAADALRFHRAAAMVAIRSAATVTPVFIRCEPSYQERDARWPHLPRERPHFSLEVGEDIDPAPIRANASAPVATRTLTERLRGVFAAAQA